MFLNWRDSTKSVLVVLMFRAGQRMVRVPQSALARLPLARRAKVLPASRGLVISDWRGRQVMSPACQG